MTTPTDAQLAQIAEKIFVMKDRATTRLPKPITTPTPPLPPPPAPPPPDRDTIIRFKAALDWIGTDPDLKDAGIGVIDFTNDAMHPKIWLHNENKAFRIGSASKIAMMLAAVQLRLDVRKILDLKIISTAAEFDELFRNPKLWKLAKPPQSEMQQIAGAANAPLISKIFDFTKSPVNFFGPDPKLANVEANRKRIVDKLPADGELSWEKVHEFTFAERFWLAGCMSDNVAATACISEIGVPYIKAVLRSYGLADTARGMHLLASGGYAPYPRVTRPPDPAAPRPLTYEEPIAVNDWWLNLRTHSFDDNMSHVPGSAAALAAYMIALMTDAFADPGTGLVAGRDACEDIRNNLADGGSHAILSFLAEGADAPDVAGGVSGVADTTITRQVNKIGILKKSDGAKSGLVCEFVYLETKQDPAPAAPRRVNMKYAVVANGLITSPGVIAARKSEILGAAVHNALLSL
jgi:hypothetical protein